MFTGAGSETSVRFYAGVIGDQAKWIAKGPRIGDRSRRSGTDRGQKNVRWRDVHRIFTKHPQLFHNARVRLCLECWPKGRMQVYANMTRVVSGLVVCVCLSLGLARPAHAAEATLFRLFLLDGSVLVSYGEFARVDDKVVFSMPVGGRPDE